MIRKLISTSLVALLGIVTPVLSAPPGGGGGRPGGGGGGRPGGGGGGGRPGGSMSGVRPGGSSAYHGGYHPGGGGYRPGGNYYHGGGSNYYHGGSYYRPGYGYGYGYPWGSVAIGVGLGLAANRAYYGGGYYGGYGGGYGYSAPYVSGYSSGAYVPTYNVPAQAYLPPPPAEAAVNGTSARLTVNLPVPDAKLWVDDYQSQKEGPQRTLITPPLNPGETYSYTLLALWNENGQPVSRAREVKFQAGQVLVVDFTMPEPPRN